MSNEIPMQMPVSDKSSLASVPWGYNAWRFDALGNSIPEVINTIFTKPLDTLNMFIDRGEKRDKFIYFLITGGVLVFVRPRYILVFLPTFIITCLSSSWTLWGNMYHYNIVFAVMLPFLVTSTSILIKKSIWRYALLLLVVIMNIHTLHINHFHDWSRFGRIFTSEYYHKRHNLLEIKEGLRLIPDTASVSAISHLTPHLAFREKSYFYPDVKNAEYIAINEADGEKDFYPFASSEEFKKSLEELKENNEYELIFSKKQMLLFKKKQ